MRKNEVYLGWFLGGKSLETPVFTAEARKVQFGQFRKVYLRVCAATVWATVFVWHRFYTVGHGWGWMASVGHGLRWHRFDTVGHGLRGVGDVRRAGWRRAPSGWAVCAARVVG